MNVVVTGVNGFVGKHFVRELLSNGHEVIGIGREDSAHDDIAPSLTSYYVADLSMEYPIIDESVGAIVHLAGLAAVGPSFEKPQDYINLNSAMVTNLCETYVSAVQKPRVVLISSGAVYASRQNMPVNESGLVSFESPYAVSKILNENQAAYYKSRGLECVVMRPFNHIGPGQLSGFIVPDLAEKVRQNKSDALPIKVGDLSNKRDYSDVRDVVRAYRIVATSTKTPRELVYNVASGESRSGQEILVSISNALGVDTPDTLVDQSLLRPNDSPDIRGDSRRLKDEFGWKPMYSFEQSIEDFVKVAN